MEPRPPANLRNQAPVRMGKEKGLSMILAVLAGAWSWLYTYDRDKIKFWFGSVSELLLLVVLVVVFVFSVFHTISTYPDYEGKEVITQEETVELAERSLEYMLGELLPVTLTIVGLFLLIRVWVLIDRAVKSHKWYENYLGFPPNKVLSVVLAVFFYHATWLYTYESDKNKFWWGFGLIALSLLITFSPAGGLSSAINLGVWIWALVDTISKKQQWYDNYPDNYHQTR